MHGILAIEIFAKCEATNGFNSRFVMEYKIPMNTLFERRVGTLVRQGDICSRAEVSSLTTAKARILQLVAVTMQKFDNMQLQGVARH